MHTSEQYPFLIDLINNRSRPFLYVAATGAGVGIQRLLWSIPGASSFLVGARFTYDALDTTDFLGFRPQKFVCVETAIDLALASYYQVCRTEMLDPRTGEAKWQPTSACVGIGLTASVASRDIHRGDHQIEAAIVTNEYVYSCSLRLNKRMGEDARAGDGDVADDLAMRLLQYVKTGEWSDAEPPTERTEMARERVLTRPWFGLDGSRRAASGIVGPPILYPGSFNPPHAGHFGAGALARSVVLMRAAVRAFVPGHAAAVDFQAPQLIYTTTVDPPHKEALSPQEMMRRAAWMYGHDYLLTTGDGLFLEKFARWPGSTFVMGADAFAALLDLKWGVELKTVEEAIVRNGIKLVVVDREHRGELFTAYNAWRKAVVVDRMLPDWVVHTVSAKWPESSSAIRSGS